MRYLLDTCVVSDFAQGHPQVLARVKAVSPEEIAVSAITEMEVAYWLHLNPRLARRLGPVMRAFFGAIDVLPNGRAEAAATAGIRAALKKRGSPIGAYDALIAGAALAADLTLVTSNVREFARVEGLRVENWR